MILKSKVQSFENPGRKRLENVARDFSKLTFDYKSDSEDEAQTVNFDCQIFFPIYFKIWTKILCSRDLDSYHSKKFN